MKTTAILIAILLCAPAGAQTGIFEEGYFGVVKIFGDERCRFSPGNLLVCIPDEQEWEIANGRSFPGQTNVFHLSRWNGFFGELESLEPGSDVGFYLESGWGGASWFGLQSGSEVPGTPGPHYWSFGRSPDYSNALVFVDGFGVTGREPLMSLWRGTGDLGLGIGTPGGNLHLWREGPASVVLTADPWNEGPESATPRIEFRYDGPYHEAVLGVVGVGGKSPDGTPFPGATQNALLMATKGNRVVQLGTLHVVLTVTSEGLVLTDGAGNCVRLLPGDGVLITEACP